MVAAVATQKVRREEAIPLTRAHSEGLRLMRVVAMLSIYFGHFTFTQFSAATLPGFDHWQRWSIPFFFMLAGYFAMRSLSLRSYGTVADIVDRYARLWFIAVPMLLIVPVLDHIGFDLDPLLYYLHTKFVSPEAGGPTDIAGFFWAELDAWARRLLREIHTLARFYGWSEAEILALSPLRRRCYLEMVQA